MALATLGVTSPRDYFDRLVDGTLGRVFLRRIAYVDATIGFRISGGQPFEGTLIFERGHARYAAAASSRAVDCRYDLDAALFMRVINGAADLRNAFFAGRVRIEGDKEMALKFGALLNAYYQHIEDHVVEEVVT